MRKGIALLRPARGQRIPPTETRLDLFSACLDRHAADRQTCSLKVTVLRPFVVRTEVAGFQAQSLAAMGI
ncbi:MAG: hypothetical protein ACK4JD_05820 [Thermoflexales bacterium]